MQQCSLAEVCHIDPESLGKSTDSDYSFDYISLSDVVTGKIISDQVKHIRFSESPSRARKKVKKGDVLFSTVRPNLKGIVCLREDVADTIASTGFSVIRPKDGTCGEFIYHTLLSEKTEQQIAKLVAGSSYPAINSSDVKRLKINIPSLEEQRRIAGILSTWEKAINAYDRLIALKEKQKRGIMQEIFKKTQGREVTISEILKESKVASVNPDVSRRITVKLNLGGVEKRNLTSESKSATKQFLRSAGQFIYGKQNIHKGSFGLVPEKLDGFESSQDLPAFDFIGECNPLWFYYFLSRESFYSGFENLMSGTGSKRLSPKVFLSQKIVLPKYEEQSKTAEFLRSFDDLIVSMKRKRDLLKQQKQGLMQQLLA